MTKDRKLVLRPASEDDAAILFEWVNLPDSLAGKLLTKGPIAWNDHVMWFNRRLEDPDSALWIGEIGGRAIGQVRLERRDDGLIVDIYIAGNQRGHGYATEMLGQATSLAQEKWPGLPLLAWVKRSNTASLKLFRRVGFLDDVEKHDALRLLLPQLRAGNGGSQSRR